MFTTLNHFTRIHINYIHTLMISSLYITLSLSLFLRFVVVAGRRVHLVVGRCLTGAMDPSVIATMDRDALKKQIENMKYQASMERWPLSKSIAA